MAIACDSMNVQGTVLFTRLLDEHERKYDF